MAIKLIVGLGNPTRQHEGDRHNVGFWFLDRLANKLRVALSKDAKYHALIARVKLNEGDLWLMEPQTYMNLSGKAVGGLARFFKIEPEEILIAHDELDFEPGTVKLKKGGGAGGHNGLKDIEAQLGSQATWRLRIGIGHPGDKNVVPDYVLNSPAPAEREAIDKAVDRCVDVSNLLIAGDMNAAMLKLHTKVQS
ncbi:MAG TPA: aminoacyl-tRNA hydrolase [Burkholderiales bacterium]|nr:aminoacyl-tRNA hydrolase [Burkholderiales bacterium]